MRWVTQTVTRASRAARRSQARGTVSVPVSRAIQSILGVTTDGSNRVFYHVSPRKLTVLYNPILGPAVHPGHFQVLFSSMQIRSFSIALASTLVASGAYWAYQDSSPNGVTSPATQPSPTSLRIGMPRPAIVFDEKHTNIENLVLPSEYPMIKETADGTKTLAMLSPEQATEKLRKFEKSYRCERGNGLVRYDTVQLPSNDPIEDDHDEQWSAGPNDHGDWMMWGVFDGHSGWSTSYMLREWLIKYVGVELQKTWHENNMSFPSPDAVDAAIKRGFVRLDYRLVHESVEQASKTNSKSLAVQRLQPALSGSCALLSFYDASSKTLRVACTGDSRAVLGRRASNGLWEATPLSTDQTGGTPEEVERLRREHPNEPNVVRNGRILGGLEPSRAFGDAIYKWSHDVAKKVERDFLGRSPRPSLLTPPYVTAEPVVTRTQIQPENGDFVVMATDGLWEFLSNEEVVGLVGKWLEKNTNASQGNRGWTKKVFSFGGDKSGLPVQIKEQAQLADPGSGNAKDVFGQRAPIRAQFQGDDVYTVEDSNAATHLIRNALGGKKRDQVCALLTLPAPYSRRRRDDMTVEVIFFGEQQAGNNEIYLAAEGSGGELKAKL